MSQPDTPIFSGMSAPAGNQPQTPPPVNQLPDIDAQVQAVVNARLAEVEAKYQDRIAALEQQLKATGPPASAFTAHAAGPGYTLAGTWSQYLQEAARNGTLTEDMLRSAGVAEDVISDVLKVA